MDHTTTSPVWTIYYYYYVYTDSHSNEGTLYPVNSIQPYSKYLLDVIILYLISLLYAHYITLINYYIINNTL